MFTYIYTFDTHMQAHTKDTHVPIHRECARWEPRTQIWSSDDCVALSATRVAANCSCRQLGIFAVTIADGSLGRSVICVSLRFCSTSVSELSYTLGNVFVCMYVCMCIRCGDGRVTYDIQNDQKTGEECDDGAMQNGDGCNRQCRIEPWWSCSAPSTFRYSYYLQSVTVCCACV